jgi:hypothetical protein
VNVGIADQRPVVSALRILTLVLYCRGTVGRGCGVGRGLGVGVGGPKVDVIPAILGDSGGSIDGTTQATQAPKRSRQKTACVTLLF